MTVLITARSILDDYGRVVSGPLDLFHAHFGASLL
jgi:hypothetical protein